MDLDFVYCMVATTLLISSIYLSVVNKDTEIFSKFNSLLNDFKRRYIIKL